MCGFNSLIVNKLVVTIIGSVAAATREATLFTKITVGLLAVGLAWFSLSRLASFIKWIWVKRGLRELARRYYLKLTAVLFILGVAGEVGIKLQKLYGDVIAKYAPLFWITLGLGLAWGAMYPTLQKKKGGEAPGVGKVDAWVVNELAQLRSEVAALSEIKELKTIIEQLRRELLI